MLTDKSMNTEYKLQIILAKLDIMSDQSNDKSFCCFISIIIMKPKHLNIYEKISFSLQKIIWSHVRIIFRSLLDWLIEFQLYITQRGSKIIVRSLFQKYFHWLYYFSFLIILLIDVTVSDAFHCLILSM